MTSNPSDPAGPGTPRVPAADDTAAFQRFYFADGERSFSEPEQPVASRSLLYRVFVGWWRDRK
jgi:hypothetical protein